MFFLDLVAGFESLCASDIASTGTPLTVFARPSGAGSFDSLFRSEGSLFARNNSLFMFAGNSIPTAWNDYGVPAARVSAGRESREFPCIFPANQGTDPGDEFAPDPPHRLSVCLRGDFRPPPTFRPRSVRDSAGFGACGFAQVNQRRQGSRPDDGVPRVYLRGQVQRSACARDSPVPNSANAYRGWKCHLLMKSTTEEIPAPTEERLKRAIPARTRERLMQGKFESGEGLATFRESVGLTPVDFARAIDVRHFDN